MSVAPSYETVIAESGTYTIVAKSESAPEAKAGSSADTAQPIGMGCPPRIRPRQLRCLRAVPPPKRPSSPAQTRAAGGRGRGLEPGASPIGITATVSCQSSSVGRHR